MENSGDSLAAKGIGFQYEIYAKTKLQQQKNHQSFNELFKQLFLDHYRLLSKEARAIASAYAGVVVKSTKENLDKFISAHDSSDTLSLNNAKALVNDYNSYVVYSQTQKLMQLIVIAEDNKDFNVEKVLIKTKDGSTVQAFIVRKKEVKGKLPAVFIFNIYANSTRDVSNAKRYANAGFVGISANTRGKAGSPQTIEPFEHDASDAYDIIDWISKQKWSNGKVGMTGGSYLGFSQWAAAKTLHPALKTIMPEVAVMPGIDFPMKDNIFKSYMLQWIHFVSNSKETDYADFFNKDHWNAVFRNWYRQGASFRSLDTLEGRPNAIFQRWLRHPSFDSYWQNMTSYKTDFSRINIPVLTTTGYFDDDQCGDLYYYRQHYLNNPNANNYLVIGPYAHVGAQGYPSKVVNGYTVDPVATTFNFYDLSIQWFNYVLKDSVKPALLKDKVNYEVMGANEWRHAASLAGMSNDTLTFYLGNTKMNEYYKLESQPNASDYIKQEVDFKDRSDTTDNHEYQIIDSVLPKNNSLTFISQPFDKPVVVSGSFIGNLQATINKKDMDIKIMMYEQMPDGKFFALDSTYLRSSYAKDKSKRQLLEPGRKESIPISNSYLTSKQLSSNSRLIIVLSILKQNDHQINYGTGKDVSDETIEDAKEPLEIKWFGDSFIKIPVWK